MGRTESRRLHQKPQQPARTNDSLLGEMKNGSLVATFHRAQRVERRWDKLSQAAGMKL